MKQGERADVESLHPRTPDFVTVSSSRMFNNFDFAFQAPTGPSITYNDDMNPNEYTIEWLTPIDRITPPLAIPVNVKDYDSYDRSVFALDRQIGQLSPNRLHHVPSHYSLPPSSSHAFELNRIDSLPSLALSSYHSGSSNDHYRSGNATPIARTPPSSSPMDSLSTSPSSSFKEELDARLHHPSSTASHRRGIQSSGDYATPPRGGHDSTSSSSSRRSLISHKSRLDSSRGGTTPANAPGSNSSYSRVSSSASLASMNVSFVDHTTSSSANPSTGSSPSLVRKANTNPSSGTSVPISSGGNVGPSGGGPDRGDRKSLFRKRTENHLITSIAAQSSKPISSSRARWVHLYGGHPTQRNTIPTHPPFLSGYVMHRCL